MNEEIPLANNDSLPKQPSPVPNQPLPTPPPSPLDNPNIQPEAELPPAAVIHKANPQAEPATPDFFAGFVPKYPEYEVLTPQTLQTVTLRSMTVQDEEALKGSMVNRRQTPKLINKAIYDSIVDNPFSSYDDFLAKVTIRDRDALLYGLYHVTYKDIQNYEMGCAACDKSYSIKIELSSVFKMDAWPGEKGEVLHQKYEVALESVGNTIALVKQPTLADEQAMLDDMLFASEKNIDLGIEMLIVDRFIANNSSRNPMHIVERSDIFRAFTKMLPIDRKKINRCYLNNFGKYGMNLSMVSHCSHCGHEQESQLDLLTQFFRSLFE